MVEVECRTCLGMSALENSVSITAKFLLGKSFKEVILLFAPQMVSVIWTDDIICSACLKILHAFAQLIEQIIGVERTLKGYNKRFPKDDSGGSTIVEGSFNQNGESCELNSQDEDKMWLQSRSIQELKVTSDQPLVDESAEFLRDQSTSSSQDDSLKIPSLKWVKCRTCLLVTSNSQSTSLTEQLLHGKTIKEVILYFIPTMLFVPCVGENICPDCSKILHDFAEFIERCVEVEEIFRQAKVKVEEEEMVDGPNADSPLNLECVPQSSPRSQEMLTDIQDLPESSGEANSKSDKPIRTYSGKPKINVKVVEFIKKELKKMLRKNSDTEPAVQPLFSDTSVDQGYSYYISTKQQFNTNEEIVQPIDVDAYNSINDDVSAGDNHENVSNSEITVTPLGNLDTKSLDHRNRQCQTGTTNFTKRSSIVPPSSQPDMLDRPSCSRSKDNLNNKISIGKFNIVKGDTIHSYPIDTHDRVVSLSQLKGVLPSYLEALAKRDILIYQYGIPKDLSNKRVLLLGSKMVQCPICKKFAYTPEAIRSHIKSSHGVNSPISEFTMSRSGEEKSYSHVILPSRKEEFQISKSESNTLYAYNYIPPTTYRNNCPLCNTTHSSSSFLMRHIRKMHKEFSPNKCTKCGKQVKMKRNYTLHIKKNQNFPSCNLKQCKICFQTLTKENFASHVKAHQSFVCDKCGQSFLSSLYLKMHSRTHEPETCEQQPKQVERLCRGCGKFKKNVSTDIVRHEPTTLFLCSKCPKIYLSASNLHEHINRTHHRQKYECEKCNKKCKSYKSLRAHIELKHLRTFKHSCSICGQKFARNDYLRRHMKNHAQCYIKPDPEPSTSEKHEAKSGGRRKHSYPGTAQCKYCQRSFKSIHILRYHLLTHEKKIQYKCRLCSLTFSSLYNRFCHEKKHNDPTFEFRCNICFNHTNSKEELEKHMEKHECSKKYVCQHCGKGFSQKSLFSHHLAMEHASKEELQEEKSAILSTGIEEFSI